MDGYIFYCAGQTEALHGCAEKLRTAGFCFSDTPDDSVTHLLLDVPSRTTSCLNALRKGITIIGGNLQGDLFHDYSKIDLLQDPAYLAENASITAHCAVKLALNMSDFILQGCPVLVIGWGRIGKCLAALLRQMGAEVCVAARKEADRAMLIALGYDAVDIDVCAKKSFRIVFNTVPASIASSDTFSNNCLKIELASQPGILGDDVIDGRKLPGRLAAESSGELIARSILRLLSGGIK